MEWQFPWPYQNNNPITQTLEMVHYILRFITTMKHVIYGAILSAARGSGEHCKLPQRILGRSSSGNRMWCILAWKSDIWWHQFVIFPVFPWPFRDHSNSDFFQFSPICRNRALYKLLTYSIAYKLYTSSSLALTRNNARRIGTRLHWPTVQRSLESSSGWTCGRNAQTSLPDSALEAPWLARCACHTARSNAAVESRLCHCHTEYKMKRTMCTNFIIRTRSTSSK